MDYLWRDYSPQNRYELDFSMKHSSPPIEVSFRGRDCILINPLPRFANIFLSLLKRQDLWEHQKDKMQALANCLLHLLGQLDRISGMSSSMVVCDEIEQSLIDGHFGDAIKKAYIDLTFERQRIVLDFLRRQEQSKGRKLYFREAVKAIFPSAGIYFYNLDAVFLIYLPQEKNISDEECIELLISLFLDVTAKHQVYWEYPFGIIGRKETMRLNHTRLYGKGKDF